MANVTVKVANGIRKLLEDIVQEEYKKRGFNDVRTDVTVEFPKSICVMINTENPFLGMDFWKFLSELGTRMDNAVKVFGFNYKETKYLHDFCCINYEYKEG